MTGDLENSMILLASVRVLNALGPILQGQCKHISNETIAFAETRVRALEMELADDMKEAALFRMGDDGPDSPMPQQLRELFHMLQHIVENSVNTALKMDSLVKSLTDALNKEN